jgi:hypothetical protein
MLARILPALLTLRHRVWHRGLFLVWWRHFGVFVRQVYHLGIQSKVIRPHYWRVLPNPEEEPACAGGLRLRLLYLYYLHQHVDCVRRVMRYLSASPDDVLMRSLGPIQPPRRLPNESCTDLEGQALAGRLPIAASSDDCAVS